MRLIKLVPTIVILIFGALFMALFFCVFQEVLDADE